MRHGGGAVDRFRSPAVKRETLFSIWWDQDLIFSEDFLINSGAAENSDS